MKKFIFYLFLIIVGCGNNNSESSNYKGDPDKELDNSQNDSNGEDEEYPDLDDANEVDDEYANPNDVSVQ